MLKKLSTLCLAIIISASPAFANSSVVTGDIAPDFEFTDTNGNTQKLSDLKGNPVVLEWSNHSCPYVIKHYETGNMQKLQKAATENNVTWLTIVSSAEGKQGHTTIEQANKIVSDNKASPTAKILDASGEIGNLYGARTTPHMYVIDKDGILVYQGAIDDNNSHKPDTVESAHNYVTAALESLKKGEAVETSSTKPYGCGVKY